METDGSKPKREWKNVFVRRVPETNKPIFQRRKVDVIDPNNPPEPPLDKGLMTEEEYKKFKAGQEDGSQPLVSKAYTQDELIPSNKETED